jgi:hypothetical protein
LIYSLFLLKVILLGSKITEKQNRITINKEKHVKLSLYFTKHHDIKKYRGVKI